MTAALETRSVEPEGPGCAAVAQHLDEPCAGTASPIRSWLAVEHPGPWSRDVRERVLAQALPPAAGRALTRLAREQGLRAVLVRRPGRPGVAAAPGPRTVLVGGAVPGRRWQERLTLDRLSDLAAVDLEAIASGAGGLGEPVDGPVFLVCTHGAKDRCCALLGRPVASAVRAAAPDGSVWECTHLGGDRFAGNVLVLPDGQMYGQVEPRTVPDLVSATLAGQVLPAHLRGRTAGTPPEQAAEIEVRRRTGLLGLDEVLATGWRHRPERGGVEVTVRAGARTDYRVLVARRPLGSCATSVCSGVLRPAPLTVEQVVEVVPAA